MSLKPIETHRKGPLKVLFPAEISSIEKVRRDSHSASPFEAEAEIRARKAKKDTTRARGTFKERRGSPKEGPYLHQGIGDSKGLSSFGFQHFAFL